ncbi:MAG TPA: peptidylprolyl isomerase [Steroidobacteraceae bacterium]|nr:peptidylprolyl isomerase [Steroidobacteraceae bacterium]
MKTPGNLSPLAVALTLLCPLLTPAAAAPPKPAAAPTKTAETARKPPTTASVIAASTASDWRPLDERHTLYMELPSGRVIIELAPQFAPHHVANIEALAREGYYDGLAIVRAQDNYVVQWADPEGKRSVKNAQRTLAAEFERPSRGVPFTPLPDPDTYAPEVGFSDGFPAAVDPKFGRAWLVHCYGMVGAGRDNDVDSGGGTELYAVIGQAPRHLDRNVTLVGRVVQGMELLSTLPRGTGALGFYEKSEQRLPIKSIRVAADVPPAERTELEVLRTDTPTFAAYVEARRNRREEWFKVPAGRVDVCNVPVPSRPRSGTPAS